MTWSRSFIPGGSDLPQLLFCKYLLRMLELLEHEALVYSADRIDERELHRVYPRLYEVCLYEIIEEEVKAAERQAYEPLYYEIPERRLPYADRREEREVPLELLLLVRKALQG